MDSWVPVAAIGAVESRSNLIETREGYADIGLLIEEIASNSGIDSLDLSNNELTTEEIVAIAQALEVNVTLEKLNLEGNEVTAEGIEALASALTINQTLRELRIGQIKPIGLFSEKCLANAISANTTIIRFVCSIENMEYREVIEHALARNLESFTLLNTARTVYATESAEVHVEGEVAEIHREIKDLADEISHEGVSGVTSTVITTTTITTTTTLIQEGENVVETQEIENVVTIQEDEEGDACEKVISVADVAETTTLIQLDKEPVETESVDVMETAMLIQEDKKAFTAENVASVAEEDGVVETADGVAVVADIPKSCEITVDEPIRHCCRADSCFRVRLCMKPILQVIMKFPRVWLQCLLTVETMSMKAWPLRLKVFQ
ncbi:hypothetical protein BDR26DRAFT_69487 [Obelidium mucronatum]|nr:hypothetical protein BDR26DRAFT_69487 [Obelidium mucronatum]